MKDPPSKKLYDKVIQEFAHRVTPSGFPWRGNWIVDEQIALFLAQWVPDLKSAYELNQALMRSASLKILLQQKSRNEKGVYRFQFRCREGRKCFYFVASNDEPPNFKHTADEWKAFASTIYYRASSRNRNKRKNQATPSKDDDTISTCSETVVTTPTDASSHVEHGDRVPSPGSLSNESIPENNSNSDDTNNGSSNQTNFSSIQHVVAMGVCNFFGGRRGHGGELTRDKLERWIKSLLEAENSYDKMMRMVNKANEEPPPRAWIPKILTKARMLRRAYQLALQTMEAGATWGSCCDTVIAEFRHTNANLSVLRNSRTLQEWNIQFRTREGFPHPSPYVERGKRPCPFLFEIFPEALKTFQDWASKRLEELSCELAAGYIRAQLIPAIYEKERANRREQDRVLTLDEFRSSIRMTTVSFSTASRILSFAGFRFSDTKKTYYNDRHEHPENVDFEVEKLAHRWVQIPVEEAIRLENCDSASRLMKDVWAFEFTDPKNNKRMREYHIDCFPEVFFEYVKEENKPFGGNLSHKFPSTDRRPVMIIGQDEAVFKQWSFSKKSWHDHRGRGLLLPKDDGHGIMLSAFVGRVWGFYLDNEGEVSMLTRDVIAEINNARRDQVYLAKDSAQKVLGGCAKRLQQITDASPFCTFFDYGTNNDGYWTYDTMALQLEDLVDCLKVLFPDFDFVFLFDHSSNHGKKQQDGLNEKGMNIDWGGAVAKMHDTVVESVGPFTHPHCLQPGSTQCMIYTEEDRGPFSYKQSPLTDEQRETMKYDRVNPDETKKHNITKQELVNQLVQNEIAQGAHFGDRDVQAYLSKSFSQLQGMSRAKELPVEEQRPVMEQGWLGQPKGLMQVLWERGFIDPANAKKYVKDKRAAWLDETGKEVRDDKIAEYQKYSLTYLMGKCEDFKEEKSALEQLAADLSTRYNRMIRIMASTKFHCEFAGEGIEYGWGFAKRVFRSMKRLEKDSKDNFVSCVRKSIDKVSLSTMRKFGAKARRYMLTYHLFDNHRTDAMFESDGLSYAEIEKYVDRTMKTHRCTLDQEHSFIQKAWKESQEAER